MNHKIIGLSTHDSSFKRFGRDTLLSGPYLYKKGLAWVEARSMKKDFFFLNQAHENLKNPNKLMGLSPLTKQNDKIPIHFINPKGWWALGI